MSLPANQLPPGTPVLVTGGTGFTGSALVRSLVQHGARVRAVARASSRLEALASLPVEWIRGEVHDPQIAEAAVRGMSYVFHLAAAYRHAGVADEVYRQVHVDSTLRLADAAARATGFVRFVHVSTIGVHGHIERPPATEDSPFRPGDLYQATKAEGETRFRELATRAGLDFSIVRPCAIYGPGDVRLLKMFRMVRRGVFPLLGGGDPLYHLIHVDDLVDALLLAAIHPAASGEAFIAGNREPIALTRMAHLIAASLGRTVRIVRLPAAPFVAAAALCETICRPFGLDPPLHRRRVAFYTKTRSFDTSKIRERLGFAERLSNEEGLAATTRWYVAQGWL